MKKGEKERETRTTGFENRGKTGEGGRRGAARMKEKTDYGKWRGMLDDLLTYWSGRRMEDWKKENGGIEGGKG